jgi:hypothetical protein
VLKGSRVAEDPIVAHSCSYGDISPSLARYLNDGAFLPLLLVFVELNQASSMNMSAWGMGLASNSMIL